MPALKKHLSRPTPVSDQPRVAVQEGVAMTPLLNIAEVARLLAVSKVTIRRKVSTGELPCIRLTEGGPMRFDIKDVEKFISAHKT